MSEPSHHTAAPALSLGLDLLDIAPGRDRPTFDPRQQAHIVTRHDDALVVLRSPAVEIEALPSSRVPAHAHGEYNALERALSSFALFQNAPHHAPLRRWLVDALQAIGSGFTSERVAAKTELLLSQSPVNEPFDALTRLCDRIPLELMSEALGLDVAAAQRIVRASTIIASSHYLSIPSGARKPAALNRLAALAERLEADARDTAMAALSLRLPKTEFEIRPSDRVADPVFGLVFLLLTGIDTTSSLLAVALSACLLDANVRTHFDREGVPSRRAVTELLRLAASVRVTKSRIATSTIDGGDWSIPAGSRVLVNIPRANRTLQVHHSPNVFIPDGERPPALTFGVGTHRCVGAQLATTMVTSFLSVMLRHRDVTLATASVPRAPQASFLRPSHLPIIINYRK